MTQMNAGSKVTSTKQKVPFLRTSERVAFKRCPQRWYWSYRQGLVPKGPINDNLWFGTGVHLALAEWYCGPGLTRGPHPAETWNVWVDDEIRYMRTAISDNWREDKYIEAGELGTGILEAYVEQYGRDESWSIIAPETPFQIDIPSRSGNRTLVTYAGTFDLVYRDLTDGKIKLGEHKTAKAISLSHLPLDDQAGSYWAIASQVLEHSGAIKKGEVLDTITYNFLRKSLPDQREQNAEGKYLNKNGTISKVQPAPLFVREEVYRSSRERANQIERIANEAQWMNIIRSGKAPPYKTPTRDCSWDCSFYEMCMLHERGGDDWKEYKRSMFKVEDPYAAHRSRKSAE